MPTNKYENILYTNNMVIPIPHHTHTISYMYLYNFISLKV